MDEPLRRRITPWVAAIPIGAALLNFALFPHYTGDDAFIHFTYVRNLLERCLIAYNGPEASFGSTSILWILLGALASWPTGDIPLTMRMLGAGLVVLSVFLAVAALHRQVRLALRAQLLLAVFLTANAVLFRWMFTGMETGLVCLVTVLFMSYADPQRPVLTAFLCLVAFLTRPEFLLLPISFLVATKFGGSWDRRAVVRFVSVCAALFGLWFALACSYFGRIMPMTAIKSVGWIDVPSTLRILQVGLGAFPALVLVLAVLSFRKYDKGSPRRAFRVPEWTFLLFGGALLAFYLIRGTNLISRYLMVLYFPLAMIGSMEVIRRWIPGGRIRWRVGMMIFLVLSIEGGAFSLLHAPHIRGFVEGFQRVYTDLGKRLERLEPADSGAVMVSDVGMVGYYSRRRVIDLAGLTSSHVYEAGTLEDSVLVARYHPRFVIYRGEDPGIPAYEAMLASIVSRPTAVKSIYHASIPPLKVMSDPAQRWQVVLYEVAYEAQATAPYSLEKGTDADSPRGPAD